MKLQQFFFKVYNKVYYMVKGLTCASLDLPLHATINFTGKGVQRRARYICNEGFYRQSGSSSRRCTGGGTWEGSPAVCQSTFFSKNF